MDKVKLMSELSFGDVIPPSRCKRKQNWTYNGQTLRTNGTRVETNKRGARSIGVESHQKAAAAWERGFYSDLVTEFNGASKDDNIRPDSSMDKMKKLRPCFEKSDGVR